MNSLRRALILVTALVAVLSPALLTAMPAYADAKSDVCNGVGIATGSPNVTNNNCADNNSLNGIIKTVVTLLSTIVGVAAIIMIIIGGFRYVISGGDAANTNSAKNTIIYALIGLLIAALAQVLVHFVLSKV